MGVNILFEKRFDPLYFQHLSVEMFVSVTSDSHVSMIKIRLRVRALFFSDPSLDFATPFVESVAACSWTTSQRPEIRQLLLRPENYQLYRCPPSFDETADDGPFM